MSHEAPRSTFVSTVENTPDRWTEVLTYFASCCSTLRESRAPGKVVLNAIIDVSGSMDGIKLICVKLGLCALISNLADDDEVNITSFSKRTKPVTNGFTIVRDLRRALPQLLSRVWTDGATACYDAAIQGLQQLKSRYYYNSNNMGDDSQTKYIQVVLTDGEDNESNQTADAVYQLLCQPGFNRFMFILVAVDMLSTSENSFRTWMNLVHSKQIR
jgi:uncharacterized protein with von Willebrand factor type A (vWA) domain